MFSNIILEDVLSKEPLAPASAGSDQNLSDAMRWGIYALIYAEEQVNEAVRKDGPHKGYAEYLFYRKEN